MGPTGTNYHDRLMVGLRQRMRPQGAAGARAAVQGALAPQAPPVPGAGGGAATPAVKPMGGMGAATGMAAGNAGSYGGPGAKPEAGAMSGAGLSLGRMAGAGAAPAPMRTPGAGMSAMTSPMQVPAPDYAPMAAPAAAAPGQGRLAGDGRAGLGYGVNTGLNVSVNEPEALAVGSGDAFDQAVGNTKNGPGAKKTRKALMQALARVGINQIQPMQDMMGQLQYDAEYGQMDPSTRAGYLAPHMEAIGDQADLARSQAYANLIARGMDQGTAAQMAEGAIGGREMELKSGKVSESYLADELARKNAFEKLVAMRMSLATGSPMSLASQMAGQTIQQKMQQEQMDAQNSFGWDDVWGGASTMVGGYLGGLG